MNYSKKLMAFSIAEAMITLLIASVALAMTAPLLSKRMQPKTPESTSQAIPKGAVMYFALNECPVGWQLLSEKYYGTDDIFIRNFNPKDTNGRTLGSIQLDAAPNITGSYSNISFYSVEDTDGDPSYETFDSNGALYNTPNQVLRRGFFSKAGDDYRGGVSIDASRSSSAYGRIEADGVTRATEVRPKNIALLACIKK